MAASRRELFAIERWRREPCDFRSGNSGLPGPAVEHVDVAGLGDLRDRVDFSAVARDRHQARRGGKIEIPDVVLDRLENARSLRPVRASSASTQSANRLSPIRLEP